jgi:hypothetical protein
LVITIKNDEVFAPREDITHTSDFGGMQVALIAIENAIEAKISEFTQYLSSERPEDFLSLYTEETPDSSPGEAAPMTLLLFVDFITGEEIVSFVVRASNIKERQGLSIIQCLEEASNLGLLYEGFSAEAFITRGKIYRLLVSMLEISKKSSGKFP